MFFGLRTAIYPVAAERLAEAKAWYALAAGKPPYFDEPFYVGFDVGGYELGLVPDGQPSLHGSQVYWGTANAHEELLRLVALGGILLEAVKDVGGGILVAAVADPFGNRLAIIQNPQFDASRAT